LVVLIVLTGLISACSAPAFQVDAVQGSGNVTSETRRLGEFSSIENTIAADVLVSFGDTQAVVVEAEDNLLPNIETVVKGRTLTIHTKPNTSIANTRPVRIFLTMQSLDAADLSSSGSIEIDNVEAEKLKLDLSSSGSIRATGTVEVLTVTLNSSGTIDCEDLRAGSASVTNNSSGKVTVLVQDSLDVTLSGSGRVAYYGDPAEVKQSITGSGSVAAE